MTKCPKCGSAYISGPHYESGVDHATFWKGSHERLRYRCERCGYSMTTETLDAKEKKAPVTQRS